MYNKAKTMVRQFARFSIRHTLRAGNKDADRLANAGLDRPEVRVSGKLIERHRADS
jgi:ribonuclease HI